MSALAQKAKGDKAQASGEVSWVDTAEDEEPVLLDPTDYLSEVSKPKLPEPPAPSPRRKLPMFVGGFLIVAVAGYFVLRPGLDPLPDTDYTGQILPLPLEPGADINVMFAQLGSANPEAVQQWPSMVRYRFPSVTVDLDNGFVYRIELNGPARTWERLRVGMGEDEARGALALLGDPSGQRTDDPPVRFQSGYRVFPSLAERPENRLTVQVRPPNGCFDLIAVLRPTPIGILKKGESEFAAVAKGSDDIAWGVEEVVVVDRKRAGPLGPAARC